MAVPRDHHIIQNLHLTREVMRILAGSPLFEGLSEPEIRAIIPRLRPVLKRYEKDGIIVEAGKEAKRIGFVVSGRIAAKKIAGEGRAHIFAIHEPGDHFNLDAALSVWQKSPLTFIAETVCVVLFISASPFSGKQSQVMVPLVQNANRILCQYCFHLLNKADILTRQSLRERLLICFRSAEEENGDHEFVLNMTREQLAQYLCVNRSALCRELSRMQNEGIIRLKPGRYVLLKKEP